ncbi:beta-lactamase-like protein [Xylariomycetidae sp. FL2044]|nr:beta-lactamase-like protein [Xylariomycetidae sp. FL2044]
MASPPELNIPPSTSTVDVSIINTTGTMRGVDACRFLEPQIPGHDWLAVPCYAFLIQHPSLRRSLVFDLGLRQDLENFPPPLAQRIRASGYTVDVPRHVREILDEHGVDTKAIEAVVWSHWHLDHVGNPSTFDPGTALIVGPGCKEHMFPGYPTVPHAPFLEADVAGREIRELDFSSGSASGSGSGSGAQQQQLKIGQFAALDYFGDGSFYFLDTPGHAVGHICGLARVTSSPDSFILMGGDLVHHGGELRPHPWHPLPSRITPHPFFEPTPCPGEMFAELLRAGPEAPFYLPAERPPIGEKVHYDVPLMIATIRKAQELDAHSNILVVPAHDQTMLGVVDFFPARANDFVRKGWVHKTRWAFLADFARAVGYEGVIESMGDYSRVVITYTA